MTLKVIATIIAVFILFVLLLVCYFYNENRKFSVREYVIQNDKLPASFRGLKFAFISDLHSWVYGEDNEPVIQAIDEQNPDYVLIGGDMFVKGPEFDATVAIDFIMQLVTKYPVIYSFGNHELRVSELAETKDTSFVEYINTLKNIGVTFLVDDELTLHRENDIVHIVGLNLSERYYKKFSKNNLTVTEITRHIGEAKKEDYTILLAHNPRYFEEYSDWGADLVLSGHVHGGIIVLPFLGGVISTQGLLFPKYDFGLFRHGQASMIVSRGLGNHTVKIRFNNRAEVSMITLK
ncbi:MAG: metallophosphoesterase [bacterium]|nr:metallophosphoesterase [bacterium]